MQSYSSFLKKLFSYIASICPAYSNHLHLHFDVLNEVWLTEIKKYKLEDLDKAFSVFIQTEIQRFPQVAHFISIVKSLPQQAKALRYYNPNPGVIKDYQTLCNKLFGVKEPAEIEKVLSKMRSIEVGYDFETLQNALTSQQKSIYRLKTTAARFKISGNFENDPRENLFREILNEIALLEQEHEKNNPKTHTKPPKDLKCPAFFEREITETHPFLGSFA